MPQKILVIDDELDFSQVLKMVLISAGYEVEIANTGREAIGAYIYSVYKNEPVDLILLDIRMPGINGLEILELVRKEEKLRGIKEESGVPIIVMTAYDEPWMDPLLIKGTKDYIIKSSSSDEILDRIKKRLVLKR